MRKKDAFCRGSCLFLKIHDTQNCVHLRAQPPSPPISRIPRERWKQTESNLDIAEWKRIILIHPPWNYRARFPSNLKTSVVNLKRNTNVHPAPRCNWNCPNFCETSFKDFFPSFSSFFFFISRLKVQAEIEKKERGIETCFFIHVLIYRSFDSFLWENNGIRSIKEKLSFESLFIMITIILLNFLSRRKLEWLYFFYI